MASFEAVREVSDALVAVLRAGVPPLVGADDIVLSTPHAFGAVPDRPALTVFLYRITLDSLRFDTSGGVPSDGIAARPRLPIELHYMITAWSNDTRGELAIAGRVLQVLHDHPMLGPPELQGDSWVPDDSVQLLFESLPIEEHYRAWGTSDVPYRLSLTCMARGVGIAPTEAPGFAPVLQRTIG